MGSRNYAAHQEWSAYFLDKILKEGGAGTIALKHHNPESNLEYMVAVADKLSAAEREDWVQEKNWAESVKSRWWLSYPGFRMLEKYQMLPGSLQTSFTGGI